MARPSSLPARGGHPEQRGGLRGHIKLVMGHGRSLNGLKDVLMFVFLVLINCLDRKWSESVKKISFLCFPGYF